MKPVYSKNQAQGGGGKLEKNRRIRTKRKGVDAELHSTERGKELLSSLEPETTKGNLYKP